MSLEILTARSASLPISKESSVSNAFFVSAGIVVSVKLTHPGIGVPQNAGIWLFMSSFVIVISCSISIVFFAAHPAHSFDFK